MAVLKIFHSDNQWGTVVDATTNGFISTMAQLGIINETQYREINKHISWIHDKITAIRNKTELESKGEYNICFSVWINEIGIQDTTKYIKLEIQAEASWNDSLRQRENPRNLSKEDIDLLFKTFLDYTINVYDPRRYQTIYKIFEL